MFLVREVKCVRNILFLVLPVALSCYNLRQVFLLVCFAVYKIWWTHPCLLMFLWGVIFEKCFESTHVTRFSSIAEHWAVEGWWSQESECTHQVLGGPFFTCASQGSWKGPPEARQVLDLSGAQPVEGAGNMCPLSIGTDVASEQSEINCLVLLNLNPSS